MITPPETMFIILGMFFLSGMLVVYAVALLSNKIKRLEKELCSFRSKTAEDLE